MLTKVEVKNDQNVSLAFPLQDVSLGYFIKEIEGLDPVKATISSSNFARLDGTQYQSSRRESRNIVLKIGLVPNYLTTSVSSLRQGLYGFFMPKSFATLNFYEDDVLFASISGRIESFETPLFSKEPEIAISIMCFNPDFVSPTQMEIELLSNYALIETPISYSGSVETGFIFQTVVDRDLPTFSIHLFSSLHEERVFTVSGSLIAGDLLEISTVSGDKWARRTRGTVTTSFLYRVIASSDWLTLRPGLNILWLEVPGEHSGYIEMPATITYFPKYGGL